MKKFLILVALTFCFNNGYAEIIIDNEWARLTPNGMGAVYFEIKNTNTEDDFLINLINHLNPHSKYHFFST